MNPFALIRFGGRPLQEYFLNARTRVRDESEEVTRYREMRNRRIPQWVALVLPILCSVSICWGATYYVSPSGDNTNPGSQSQPWATIQKAADVMVAGDTAIVASGTYEERVVSKRHGTESGYITFQAGESVLMRGFQLLHDYYRIQGFRISGTPAGAFQGAIQIGPGASYVELVDNLIFDTTLNIYGIQFTKGGNAATDSADHCTLRNNIIRNINFHCLSLFGLNHLIEGNTFDYPNGYDAMRIFGSGHVFRRNYFFNISEKEGVSNHVDIFQTFGNNLDEANNMLFEYNYAKDCNGQLMMLELNNMDTIGIIRNWTFRNNVFDTVTMHGSVAIPEVKFYNNTFYRCTQNTGHVLNYSAIEGRGAGHDGEVFNNVFIECGKNPNAVDQGWFGAMADVTGFRHDYNFVAGPAPDYPPKQTSWVDPRFAFTDEHGVNGGDPKFMAPGDFHLQAGSPAIDRGTELPGFNTDFDGRLRTLPWDIGAYEFDAGYEAIAPPQNLRIVSVATEPTPTPAPPLSTLTVTLPGDVTMEFIRIPAGAYLMGSPEPPLSPWHTCEWVSGPCDQPQHQVTIAYDFYLGKYEVTQEQYEAVMGVNPSKFVRPQNPVEHVGWDDAHVFIDAMNQLGQGTFRLPSESEWEYAARAGTTTRFFFGDSICNPTGTVCPELDLYAWWGGNNPGNPQPVGQKLPSPWGLYDIYGNVYEWVEDDFVAKYNDAPTDGSPRISPGAPYKALRGGWRVYTEARKFTSFFRAWHAIDFRHDSTGLRLLRVAD